MYVGLAMRHLPSVAATLSTCQTPLQTGRRQPTPRSTARALVALVAGRRRTTTTGSAPCSRRSRRGNAPSRTSPWPIPWWPIRFPRV